VWVFFDWKVEDYERLLSDPEIPVIARPALRGPPVKVTPLRSTTPDTNSARGLVFPSFTGEADVVDPTRVTA
jgi:hypothetical protein